MPMSQAPPTSGLKSHPSGEVGPEAEGRWHCTGLGPGGGRGSDEARPHGLYEQKRPRRAQAITRRAAPAFEGCFSHCMGGRRR